MSLKLMHQGWFSRFDLPKTIEISSILRHLDSEPSVNAFRRYRSLQNWVSMYPISGAKSFDAQVNEFGRLTGLKKSFYLRKNGIFQEETHHVYCFKVLISGFYILYSKDGITIHCGSGVSPELVRKVLARLHARILLPLIKQKNKLSKRR